MKSAITALQRIARISPGDDDTLGWHVKKVAQNALKRTEGKLLSPAERKALRDAGKEALAGMFQGNTAALERALEKL